MKQEDEREEEEKEEEKYFHILSAQSLFQYIQLGFLFQFYFSFF